MYLAVATRPDIAYAVGILGRYSHQPTVAHLKMAKQFLRYIAGTTNTTLTFPASKGELRLQGYMDSDFAGADDRKSTTGFVFLINNTPISWMFCKQTCVSTSTTEAEYVALCSAVKEAVWMRQLLLDIGYPQNRPTLISEDNNGCISLTEQTGTHQRSKHIDVQYHYSRDAVETKKIEVQHISTEKQIADGFTKALPRVKFQKFTCGLGLTPLV